MMKFEDLTDEEKQAMLEWIVETFQPILNAIESLGDWLIEVLNQLEVEKK